jgi:dimethylamine monooxygenase subunit C
MLWGSSPATEPSPRNPMAGNFTSVPGSEHGAPTRGREYVLWAFGPEGYLAGAAWLEETDPGVPTEQHSAPAAEREVLAAIQASLATAVVGVRVVFAGPEADVYAARAVALDAGACGDEIVLLITSAKQRRVYCPHCRTTSVTLAPLAGTVPCSGCSRTLMVYHHFSRRTARYLGFLADTEDIARAVSP